MTSRPGNSLGRPTKRRHKRELRNLTHRNEGNGSPGPGFRVGVKRVHESVYEAVQQWPHLRTTGGVGHNKEEPKRRAVVVLVEKCLRPPVGARRSLRRPAAAAAAAAVSPSLHPGRPVGSVPDAVGHAEDRPGLVIFEKYNEHRVEHLVELARDKGIIQDRHSSRRGSTQHRSHTRPVETDEAPLPVKP
eukprot:CAMPEP_0119142318 /NCGR_PEP_ID=MMETSP1310-20130426/32421_1 /TAXON_ID=464262 /ORGANISM="Genus nov. species nov., Strain RCC2339" /LENGTH=188 /DNA_ID=CAMNT_0007133845 /DNA_START=268 /DNA_END=835 /DNA_ORIENTATION=+